MYVDAAVFTFFGVGVIQLKSVTLAISATAVALLVRLTERWHGRVAATIAALLLVTGPAAVVNFSPVGSAEFALLAAVIATLLLDYQRGLDATPPVMPPRVCFWCGLALWIHPVAACAIAALGVIVGLRSERWITAGWRGVPDVVLARDRSPTVRTVSLLLHGLLTLTFVFFAFTWLGGNRQWGPVKLDNPVRQLQNASVLVALAVLVRQTTGDVVARKRTAAALSWFLAGLAPTLIHVLRGGSLRLTATHLTTGTREQSLSTRSPAWPGSGMHWATARTAVLDDSRTHTRGIGRDGDRDPGDARGQSARERRPAEGRVSRPGGVRRGRRPDGRRTSGRGVEPASDSVRRGVDGGAREHDRVALETQPCCRDGPDCLDAAGIRVEPAALVPAVAAGRFVAGLLQCLEIDQYLATADYHDAYRLTFLSNERVIVVPDNGLDRYPPDRQKVEAAPDQVRIERLASSADAAASGDVLCRTPLLIARLIPK